MSFSTARMIAAVALVLLSTSALLAQEVEWSSALLPVVAVNPIEGARGSVWHTSFRALTTTPTEIPFFQGNRKVCRITCAIPTLVPETVVNPPVDNYAMIVGNPSAVFYFPASAEDDLWFYSEVYEQTSGFFTPQPVVREDDYRFHAVEFPSVPSPPSSRLLLRLYGIHNVPGEVLDVTVTDVHGVLVQDEKVELIVPPQITIPEPGFFDAAAYAELPISPSAGPLRISITTGSTLPVWAMVTITDNESHDVRIITPQ